MSSKKGFKVAMVGATGAVGEALISILAERHFPVSELVALASARSAGEKLEFGGRQVVVQDLAGFDFSGVDIAFFSAGGSLSREHAPRAVAAGAVVIDNTSEFRNAPDVPLVISEVNPHAIAGYAQRGIIANPNCSTMQMLVALAPIHRAVGIERINVATYQSVSGAGRSGIEELGRQTADVLNFQPVTPEKFSKQIAFNVIPHIDDFQDNGYTREEMKMVWETRKILEDDAHPGESDSGPRTGFPWPCRGRTCRNSRQDHGRAGARIAKSAPGVELVDERGPGGYPTPVGDAAGQDAVFVGRIREDISHPRGINLWVVVRQHSQGCGPECCSGRRTIGENVSVIYSYDCVIRHFRALVGHCVAVQSS